MPRQKYQHAIPRHCAVFMPFSTTISLLGRVCRLPMKNSWHDHHRPRICACRLCWVIIRPAPTLSQLYIGRLPRLEGYEELGVVVGHGDGDGLGDVGGGSGDGRGGSRLVWDLSRGRGAAASHQQEIEERRLPPLYNLNFLMLCHSHPNVVDGITPLLKLFQKVFGHRIGRSPFSWCTSSALRTPPKHISTGTTSGGA